MADESQLEILKQGVAAWNEWRRKGIQVDLSGADLNLVDLSEANLNEARIFGANLRGAAYRKTLARLLRDLRIEAT
jgi:uncharacterized protein YjbI with pentapeptide repeats